MDYKVFNIAGAAPIEQSESVGAQTAIFIKHLQDGYKIISAYPYSTHQVAGVQYLVCKQPPKNNEKEG